MRVHQGGQNICGASIGVLCLESYFPKPPGHIKNPSGQGFSLLYEVVAGITVPRLLNDPSPELLEPFIAAARRLEAEGVRAITGSCGFLALYQAELSRAVSLPVFVSSLLQVPMVWNMTGAGAPVGILTASASSLTPAHLRAVGAGDVPVVIEGLDETEEFAAVILRNERTRMNLDRVEAEVVAAARRLHATAPQIRALVLECTDLPPYAHAIQAELRLPIFDLTTLAGMVHECGTRVPFSGHMPY